ncbi:DUF3934 family protein [Microbacterium sp. APC 3898]|uniref:DUF3934 family protein n=2 Tax=Planococcus TaxID=1372 RepID=A0ABT7ZJG6_9BACL|nr:MULTISPECIES: DUF3934 family protein [Terrabacteria group]MBF6634918.1 DUF3934 family protein [Planococcus sp. (in: firmicutes)]MBD8014433.1 DUF3934 family protein [Planococcus wigleyi]MDN3427293.1 DUF3934 family protein [Planococcus sp. APC 4016]MDN3436642.1 DUF3934 family protein [Planococcus sp. APC 3900]MDN3499574.1 DUF3934 family protein [Microbacterium sp. APC 3898]
MSKAKAKAKSGTGQGTGKKGWTRWKAGANKANSFKPYTSKTNKKADEPKTEKEIASQWVDA